MSAEGIKVLVNLIAFLIALIFSFVFILKIKLGSKSFKLLFITYTLFWIPLMLLKENTATFELRSLGDHIYL